MTNIDTMRAISQDSHGGPEVLKEVRLPRPVPGPSQILVAVRAAGVNPTDWKHRANGLFLDQLPLVLGWDVSGVVEAVGFGVTLFKPGDEVFGMLPYPYGVGSHAEYVTGPARAFAHKPAGIDHVQAGALPLAALTAYQALVDTADVRPDPDEATKADKRGVRVETLLVEADHADMNAIADLVDAGALRAHIEATFPLAEAAKAHALGETERTTGKVVLVVEETEKA